MLRTLVISFSVLILVSCSKSNDGNDVVSCQKPTFETNVTSGGFSLYNLGVNASFGFFEIEYGPNGFSQGSGTLKTSSNQFSVNNIFNGTYDVYVRGNCGGDDWSEWAEPKSFIVENGISSTCDKPVDITFNMGGNSFTIYWDDYSSDANYYEIEYGLSGFQIGNGTSGTSNTKSFRSSDYTGDNIYDFYVRANCGGDDWSPWSDVSSFYVREYVCDPPSNLSAQRSSSTIIEYDFTSNGGSSHELALLTSSNTSPDSGFINSVNSTGGSYTVSSNIIYYFYARSLYSDGTKTSWAGPVQVN